MKRFPKVTACALIAAAALFYSPSVIAGDPDIPKAQEARSPLPLAEVIEPSRELRVNDLELTANGQTIKVTILAGSLAAMQEKFPGRTIVEIILDGKRVVVLYPAEIAYRPAVACPT